MLIHGTLIALSSYKYMATLIKNLSLSLSTGKWKWKWQKASSSWSWLCFCYPQHKAGRCQPQIGNKLMTLRYHFLHRQVFYPRKILVLLAFYCFGGKIFLYSCIFDLCSLQESSFTDEDECKGLDGEECLIKRSLVAHTDYIYAQRNVGPWYFF